MPESDIAVKKKELNEFRKMYKQAEPKADGNEVDAGSMPIIRM